MGSCTIGNPKEPDFPYGTQPAQFQPMVSTFFHYAYEAQQINTYAVNRRIVRIFARKDQWPFFSTTSRNTNWTHPESTTTLHSIESGFQDNQTRQSSTKCTVPANNQSKLVKPPVTSRASLKRARRTATSQTLARDDSPWHTRWPASGNVKTWKLTWCGLSVGKARLG